MELRPSKLQIMVLRPKTKLQILDLRPETKPRQYTKLLPDIVIRQNTRQLIKT